MSTTKCNGCNYENEYNESSWMSHTCGKEELIADADKKSEQDDIQEDTTSMEEKLESLSNKPEDSWYNDRRSSHS